MQCRSPSGAFVWLALTADVWSSVMQQLGVKVVGGFVDELCKYWSVHMPGFAMPEESTSAYVYVI